MITLTTKHLSTCVLKGNTTQKQLVMDLVSFSWRYPLKKNEVKAKINCKMENYLVEKIRMPKSH